MRINTNILALNAQRNLANTTRALSRAMQRLASGQRINSARDDAAGMAIGSGLEAQRRGMLQAVRNMNDARGFLATADGAMETQTQIVQRMRELSMQAANGTLSSTERSYLNSELQQLLEEFNRISMQTQFNGVNLLDGSFGTKSLQIGSTKGQTLDLSLPFLRSSDVFSYAAGSSTSTSETIGSGTFQSRTTHSTAYTDIAVTSGDLNGDGYLDLMIAQVNANVAGIFLGNGNGTFQAKTSIATGYSRDITLKDVNGDGKLDLLTSNYIDPTVSVNLGNGNGTFQARTTYDAGTVPDSIKSVDMNNDTFADILVTNSTTGVISLLLGNGNGTFQTRSTVSTVGNSVIFQTADLNGDNKMDIVETDSSNYVGVLLGNGNGTFQTRTTIVGGNTPNSITILDLSGDGVLDLAWVTAVEGVISISIGNGNGTFQARTTIVGGTTLRTVTSGDVNGDDKADLIFTEDSTNTVAVALGNGNGTFQTRTTYATGVDPYDLIAVDLTEDGVLDLVVSESGAAGVLNIFIGNSESSTTTTTPVTLGLSDVRLGTQAQAENMLLLADAALATLFTARANIGALQSRLDYAQSNALNLIENISSAKSQLMDADFAQETAEFTRFQILQQAGIAVLGQANLNSRLSLKLLKNL